MALNTSHVTPTKKLTIRSISEALPRSHYQRCPECDMLFSLPEMSAHQSAYCPRCQAKIRDGRDWSLTRLTAMAVTMLLLMPFAWSEPLLHIYLLGVRIDANVMHGIWQMTQQGIGLLAFVSLVVLSILTMIHLNVEQLWERFYPQRPAQRADERLRVCLGCHFSGYPDAKGRCPRCHIPLRLRRKQSIQKCWAALLASIVFLLPANLLPISVIYINGGRQEDTILSGIMSLASSNIAVAAVVFIASILVPFTKVIVMFTLLLSIHFKCQQGLRTRILLLRLVTWIGRWSMLDLFVISLTMSLINRDQILAFTMGPAAFYFGAAVILTILAVEWLDSRLLWDAHESGNARFED